MHRPLEKLMKASYFIRLVVRKMLGLMGLGFRIFGSGWASGSR